MNRYRVVGLNGGQINLLIIISTYLMGAECCAGDIFKKLYEQHGAKFVKLMVAEKGKDIIRD